MQGAVSGRFCSEERRQGRSQISCSERVSGAAPQPGEPSNRSGQIADWLYKKRVDTIDKMTSLPRPLRNRLSETFSLGKIDVIRVLGARDTTRKFLFRLADGNLIESVLIPASLALYGGRSDRRTICVSTQVGCAYGCKFCASGLEGFSRNLSANEIVDQLVAVEPATGEKIDDIVFMGMAEPLANLENGLRAIGIINAEWGPYRRAPHYDFNQWVSAADSQTG